MFIGPNKCASFSKQARDLTYTHTATTLLANEENRVIHALVRQPTRTLRISTKVGLRNLHDLMSPNVTPTYSQEMRLNTCRFNPVHFERMDRSIQDGALTSFWQKIKPDVMRVIDLSPIYGCPTADEIREWLRSSKNDRTIKSISPINISTLKLPIVPLEVEWALRYTTPAPLSEETSMTFSSIVPAEKKSA